MFSCYIDPLKSNYISSLGSLHALLWRECVDGTTGFNCLTIFMQEPRLDIFEIISRFIYGQHAFMATSVTPAAGVGRMGCLYMGVFDGLRDFYVIVNAHTSSFFVQVSPKTVNEWAHQITNLFITCLHPISALHQYGVSVVRRTRSLLVIFCLERSWMQLHRWQWGFLQSQVCPICCCWWLWCFFLLGFIVEYDSGGGIFLWFFRHFNYIYELLGDSFKYGERFRLKECSDQINGVVLRRAVNQFTHFNCEMHFRAKIFDSAWIVFMRQFPAWVSFFIWN